MQPDVNLRIFQHKHDRTTSWCGPATAGKLVANSVYDARENQFGYCCYFPRIFIVYAFLLYPLFIFLNIPVVCVRVFFYIYSFVREATAINRSIHSNVCLYWPGRVGSNKREMIRKSIKQKHVFIMHQCKHRLYFDGIQLNRSFLLSASSPPSPSSLSSSSTLYFCTFFSLVILT